MYASTIIIRLLHWKYDNGFIDAEKHLRYRKLLTELLDLFKGQRCKIISTQANNQESSCHNIVNIAILVPERTV